MTHLGSCFPEGLTEEDHVFLDGDVVKCGEGLSSICYGEGEQGVPRDHGIWPEDAQPSKDTE